MSMSVLHLGKLIVDRILYMYTTIRLYCVATHPGSHSVWCAVLPAVGLFVGPSIISCVGRYFRHRRLELARVECVGRNNGQEQGASSTSPFVLVVIPCHLESKPTALATIASALDSTYPRERLHIFLSMDGEENEHLAAEIASELGFGIQKEHRPACTETSLGTVRFTICIFPHGGKPNCLASTFRYIQRHHKVYLKSTHQTHVLMLDSDTIISPGMILTSASRLVSCSAIRMRSSMLIIEQVRGYSGIKASHCALLSVRYFRLRVFSVACLPASRISPIWHPYRSINGRPEKRKLPVRHRRLRTTRCALDSHQTSDKRRDVLERTLERTFWR